MKYSIVNLLFLSLMIQSATSDDLIIETKNGKIRGEKLKSENGRLFRSFKKVPYGMPPIAKLRFEAPKAVDPWSDVFDATSYPEPCAQGALGFNEGVEDCLYLSIYTPTRNLKENSYLPVLVWLHGGAFVTGSSEFYNPSLLMNKDVVLVVPQYRLGILGYFSTRSKWAYGNYGTMDQMMALKWVQENIDKFGGDPQSVTLGGDCAGGASAIYHMISPHSKALFHRVISFSGSPLMPWALANTASRLSLMMANELVCPHNNFQWLTDCFQNKSLTELIDTQQLVLEATDYLVGNSKLAPAIQPSIPIKKSKVVLPKHPLEHLVTGNYSRVPVLLSLTKDVGAYIIDMSLHDFVLDRTSRDSSFLKKLLGYMLADLKIFNPQLEEMRFKKHYLSNWKKKSWDDAIPGLMKMLNDALYNAGMLNLAKILSEKGNVHMFRFDYERGPKLFDKRNANSSSSAPIPPTTVSLGDELFALFPEESQPLNEEQKAASYKILDMVDNFIYAKVPVKGWSQFSKKGLETTILNSEGDFEFNTKFTEEEEMLDYIFQSQHYEILKEMNVKEIYKTKIRIKDEL